MSRVWAAMWSRVASSRSLSALLLAVTCAVVTSCGTAGSSTSIAGEVPVSTGDPSADPGAQGSPAAPSAGPTASARASLPPTGDLGDRLIATIDGVVRPCAMVATATDVWVTGNEPPVLARINPSTNTIESQTPMDGSPCGIAVGPDGRLWVALLSVGRVVAVDPVTAEVTDTVDDLGAQLWDLKAGFGDIWVVDRSKRELVRVVPTTATVAARIPIGRSGSGLAITADAVWVVDDVDGTMHRVDPATNVATTISGLQRGSSWFANDDRTLLLANRRDGSIIPIEPDDGSLGTPITGARSPLDGSVSDTHAYVPDTGARALVEIDLATREVAAITRLDGARNPFVSEVAFGDVWVLDFGGERIWRIRP